VFYVKLALIALATWNMLIVRRAVMADHDAAPGRYRILAAASLLLWAGAITAGRLMAYL
jgi:hypothetical protein